jgi:hypothetical protein
VLERLLLLVKKSRQNMSAAAAAFAESGHGGPIPEIARQMPRLMRLFRAPSTAGFGEALTPARSMS